MTLADIIDNRASLYDAGNTAGDGYDPTADIADASSPVHAAETTDDVSVYHVGDVAILVATDGSGDDVSRWGVAVVVAS